MDENIRFTREDFEDLGTTKENLKRISANMRILGEGVRSRAPDWAKSYISEPTVSLSPAASSSPATSPTGPLPGSRQPVLPATAALSGRPAPARTPAPRSSPARGTHTGAGDSPAPRPAASGPPDRSAARARHADSSVRSPSHAPPSALPLPTSSPSVAHPGGWCPPSPGPPARPSL